MRLCVMGLLGLLPINPLRNLTGFGVNDRVLAGIGLRLRPVAFAICRAERLHLPSCKPEFHKKAHARWAFLWNMARPRGFEPLTSASGGHYFGSVPSGIDRANDRLLKHLGA